MAIVTERGFAGLSMSRLADACDYTPGALYRYFSSKDMLLSALVERILEEVREDLAGLTLPGDEPLTRVFLMVLRYRAFARRQAHKFTLIALSFAEPELLLTSPEAAEPVVNKMIQTMAPLAEALAAAAEAGALDAGDVVERALVIFTSTQGILQMHKQQRVAPGLIDIDRLVNTSTQTLLIGWGASASSVEHAQQNAATLIASGDLS